MVFKFSSKNHEFEQNDIFFVNGILKFHFEVQNLTSKPIFNIKTKFSAEKTSKIKIYNFQ